jgi:hypothetical protein
LHYPQFYFYEGAGDFQRPDTTQRGISELQDRLDHVNSELKENQLLYFCNLLEIYKSVGQQFPNLTYDDLSSIYFYIQNISDKNNLSLPGIAYLDACVDSCYQYKLLTNKLKEEKEQLSSKRVGMIKDNGNLTKEERNPGPPALPEPITTPIPPPSFEEVVSPENNESVYYQFSIETFGWYNVDILLKEYSGSQKSELSVRIIGEYREKVDIFLIIPSSKVYTKAGKKGGSVDEYAFAYKDGSIYLPQNVKGYILAVTEANSSIAYALQEFTTSTKQELTVSLKATTKEEFNAAISLLSADKLTIKVSDSKNADSIRKTDTDLKTINEELKKAESLKPKNCDCDCGPQYYNPVTTAEADIYIK